jgi:hypothetical protein
VKYGPNTPAVELLLKQLKGITPAQIDDLGTTGDVARGASHTAAWDAVLDAAWDAVFALVVRDEISEERFEALYGPWKKVMDK